MSEPKKSQAKKIIAAFDAIPAEKKEYFLGYADGVQAVMEKKQAESSEQGDDKRKEEST